MCVKDTDTEMCLIPNFSLPALLLRGIVHVKSLWEAHI